MSDESGGSANDSNNTTSGADKDRPARKVPKTMMENQIPQIPAGESASQSNQSSDAPRKVAKTMMDTALPTREEIEKASKQAEQNRVTPKTMLEIERPKLENSRAELEKKITEKTNSPESARRVSKTMMEVSLPSQSDTLKMVRKVARTRLDSQKLDAIGAKTNQDSGSMTVKVRKTLTGEQPLPELDSERLTQTESGAGNTPATIPPCDNEPPKRERFVAKTMLDHSVLAEQLVKSHEKEKMRAAYIAQEKANEPQKEFLEVESKKMATPCSWEWTESGVNRGRVRACDKCQTKVYDFSGMEMPEAEALIFKHESRKKFSLYKRQDGKFMTRDCPIQTQRKRNFLLLVIAATLIIVAAVACMLLAPPPAKPPEQAQNTGNSDTDTAPSTEGTSTSGSAPLGHNNSSGTLDTFKPDKDGVMHFDAGEKPKETPQSNGFFTSVGGDLTTKGSQPKTAPVTTTGTSGEEDSKYWDK